MQAKHEIEGLPCGGRGRDDHPVLLKDQSQGLARVLLVVDQQDREAVRRAVARSERLRRDRKGSPTAWRSAASGSSTVNVLPRPGPGLSALTKPPWCPMTWRTT